MFQESMRNEMRSQVGSQISPAGVKKWGKTLHHSRWDKCVHWEMFKGYVWQIFWIVNIYIYLCFKTGSPRFILKNHLSSVSCSLTKTENQFFYHDRDTLLSLLFHTSLTLLSIHFACRFSYHFLLKRGFRSNDGISMVGHAQKQLGPLCF